MTMPKMKGKAAIPLLNNLKKIDSNVRWEEPFDWLFLPKSNERLEQETQILEALQEDCRQNKDQFSNSKKECCWEDIYSQDERIKGIARKLEFDFYLPEFNLAIEFDEPQHFTHERQLTFKYYPNNGFSYDVSRWQELCSMGRNDSDPPCRDWQRAFRDAVRDLRARENSLPLLRLYVKDFDEKAFKKKGTLDKLLSTIQRTTK